MKLLRFILIILASLPLAACALSGDAVKGQVLEEGSNQPIPGAIVVVSWWGLTTSGSWFVEAGTVCYHVETAITDDQGNYQTQAWSQPQHKDYTVKFKNSGVVVYKPGFGRPSTLSRAQDIQYLAPFKGTREERLAYLTSMVRSNGCDEAGKNQRDLYQLYESLYYEAKQLVIPETDLQWFRRMAAWVAVAENDTRTQGETNRRIEVFLEGHLK